MNEKKKILILANNDIGLYKFRGMLINELLDRDDEVYISVPDGPCIVDMITAGAHFIDTPVDRRGLNPATDVKLFKTYMKLLDDIQPDMVITYTIKPNIYGGLACRMKKVPYAMNITGLGTAFQRDNWLKALIVRLYKIACKNAKVIFFENFYNMGAFKELKIVDPENCKLLNGAGVDLETYRYKPYPTESEPVRFLFIGRVMQEKGMNELLWAMDQLIKGGHKCTLDIVGDMEDDYRATLDKYASGGWLTYHGLQQDVRPFIEKAHCFVLPSWHEGMANTNLESAASGRPVITSDIPGCREAIVENESGLLCTAKQSETLFRAMQRFIALPNEKREAMGKVGRAHMMEVFDKRKVVEETIKSLQV